MSSITGFRSVVIEGLSAEYQIECSNMYFFKYLQYRKKIEQLFVHLYIIKFISNFPTYTTYLISFGNSLITSHTGQIDTLEDLYYKLTPSVFRRNETLDGDERKCWCRWYISPS